MCIWEWLNCILLAKDLLTDCLTYISTFASSIWNTIASLSIHPSFVSDVTAFNVAIIGLWVPLSIEIITRISDRYKSEVIVTLFEQKWVNRWLPSVLISNLLLTVTLKFLAPEGDVSITEEVILWLVMIVFCVSLYILLKSIKTVKMYTYQTDNVLEELMRDVQNILR